MANDHHLLLVVAILTGLTAIGCAVSPRYNSLDLNLLPCENGNAPRFFEAVEYDRFGQPKFPQQIQKLNDRLATGSVTELIFFVHGWNKNPTSAEVDYQNFICRLHGRLRQVIDNEKRSGGLLVVGVFWPSTITNRPREPILVKPASYYRIRDRADAIASGGLADLFEAVGENIGRSNTRQQPLRLHLIGHSFGGRMLIGGLEELQVRSSLVTFLQAPDAVNVVLLNAALPPSGFEWISEAVATAREARTPARFTEDTGSYLFNVHSQKDSANRVLFRIASAFNDDPATCAAGACGVPAYPTVCVNEAGRVAPTGQPTRESVVQGKINAWNVDSSSIVFDHSDIYKGRLAALVADLLYDEDVRNRLPLDRERLRCPP